MEISQNDAKKRFLRQQGLHRDSGFGRGKNGVAAALRQISYLQIDTISVVSRAHEHIMSSRVPNYRGQHLSDLVKDREIFEYWGHAAAFLPFESYRFSLPVMKGWRDSRERDEKLARLIIKRIDAEGPLQSRDFEDTEKKKRGGWWEWKPAKRALEHLFLSGELMVTRRDGFQKVFDLPERVIPDGIDTSMPTREAWCRHLVMTMIQALGVATEQDLGYAKSTIRQLAKISLKEPMKHAIRELIEDEALITVIVKGDVYYSTADLMAPRPPRVQTGRVKFLSPFDNLIINRKRTLALFDFDYQLECYLPAAKRKYGYFSLPMLYGDNLIGRADIKADRSSHQLIIRNLVIEPGININATLIESLIQGVLRFAEEHACSSGRVESTTPKSLKKPIQNAWSNQ
ncbi:MAG: hypothetical protein ACI8Z1_000636 [Candidatus Azotimanducaceae bacterium]|jgi:uncharacterized protein YcaQ